MAAKIYTSPKEVKKPVIDFRNFSREKYNADVKQYTEDLRNYIKDLGYTGKNSGKVIAFPVADGKAKYMVVSLRPLRLIHMALDDEYQFQYARNLTAKDVTEKIRQSEALERLFSKKNN